MQNAQKLKKKITGLYLFSSGQIVVRLLYSIGCRWYFLLHWNPYIENPKSHQNTTIDSFWWRYFRSGVPEATRCHVEFLSGFIYVWQGCRERRVHLHSGQIRWVVMILLRRWVARWVTLTHWGRDQIDAISQTTFSNEFSSMKIYEFWIKFHWSLFLGVQLTIFQHWFR